MMLLRVVLVVCILMFNEGDGKNLAFKKPTWQTWEKASSRFAVDGRRDEDSAGGNQCAESIGSKENTWLVDLEDIQSISRIVIYHRTGGVLFAHSQYASRFLGFSLYVSNTTVKEDGMLCYKDTNFTAASIPPTMNISCDVLGRFVIYYNSRKNLSPINHDYSPKVFNNLCEVEVYGCPIGVYGANCDIPCPRNCTYCNYITGKCLGDCSLGYSGHSCENYVRKNLALHRPTTELYPFSSKNPSGKLVDGMKSNLAYAGGQCTATLENKEIAMWRVDLERISQVERIVVYARTDNKKWDANNGFRARFLGFTVAVSNKTDHTDGTICYHDKHHTIYTLPAVMDITCVAVGRYVIFYNERINGLKYPKGYSPHAFVDLCEVEVYGCPSPQYGYRDPQCTLPCIFTCKEYLENLSFGKETWQSSTFSDGTSDKAVDGHFESLKWDGKQCSLTIPSTKATWRVNLGRVYAIDHVVFMFRTDNLPWGPDNGFTAVYLGFYLYISNTTNLEDGILCHHDTTFTKQTIPKLLKVKCPYSGQFVIYYNERLPGVKYPPGYSTKAQTDFCEVQVFGCPSPVAYVPQCTKPCPSNCEKCHFRTGLCSKCKPGFDGVDCDIVCHALARTTILPSSTFNASIYDAMTSRNGLSFSEADEDGLVYINLFLSGMSSNLANISFEINKTHNVTVFLFNTEDHEIKLYNDHSKDLERWKVSMANSVIAQVSHVVIVVHYTYPFTISNMRLPLRKCFKHINN